jgi:hypothetical protein
MKVEGKDLRVDGRLIRIGRLAGDGYEFLHAPEDALERVRLAREGVDLFTFTQNLASTSPQYSYPMEWDNFAALRVTTFDHWWNAQIDGKTRNMVRKAEKKGVIVREVPFDDDLVRGITEIYNECPMRQGKPFRHYGKDIETIRRMSATFLDRSVFIGAFLDERMIGFVKLVSDEAGVQAGLMHIVAMTRHRDKSPTNALIAQAVRTCAERSISNLVYSKFAYGRKERDSLSDFKESNAFARVDVPRYYVPLTLKGRAALMLRLHHQLTDYVPESLLARLRQVRRAWYATHVEGPKEAF